MLTSPIKQIHTKVIVSGGMVERYRYERPVICTGPVKHGKSSDFKKGQWAAKNKKNAFHRLIRLVAANFGDTKGRFVTLTFKENLQDVEVANQYFNLFMKRLRKIYGNEFRYIVTIEFQKRGAVHYHMLTDLPYIKNEELRKIWGHGWVGINLVKNSKHAAIYAAKYMGKGVVDKRLAGKKNYWTSRNMLQPEVLTNEEAEEYLASIEAAEKEKYTDTSYDTEYYGKIQYVKYFVQPVTSLFPEAGLAEQSPENRS